MPSGSPGCVPSPTRWVPAGGGAAGRPPGRRRGARRAGPDRLCPGGWEPASPPTGKELAATAVLALPLAEASVKIRTGPPKDDAEDYEIGRASCKERGEHAG